MSVGHANHRDHEPMIPGIDASYDTTEVAAALGISAKTVLRRRAELGVGTNWGGRAGYRFTAAEVQRLRDARRTDAATARDPRPRRRAARSGAGAS